MKRIACTVAMMLLLSGCPPKPPDDPEKEKLRQQLEEERSNNSTLKLVAGILISVAVIALLVGAALGTKAKEDGDGE